MTSLAKVKGVVLAGRFVALQEDGDVLTCWFGLKLGVYPAAITAMLKKGTLCIDFNHEMTFQLTVDHPYLSLYSQKLGLIISDIFVSVISFPTISKY